MQQSANVSTSKYSGSLNRPHENKSQAPKLNSTFQEQNVNTMPMNRINNVQQRNSIYQATPKICTDGDEKKNINQINSFRNQSLSQTPPPPPMPPIQPSTGSKNNYSGIGTHV